MVGQISPFEHKARLLVGWLIQSIEVVAMVGLVGKMRGSPVVLVLPDWVTAGYNLIFSVSVVLGSALCWRFPDARRYVGMVAVLLILTSLTDNFATGIAPQDAKLPTTRLEALQKSAPYLRIQSERSNAERDLMALVDRTATIPPEFTTQYNANEAGKKAIRILIADLDWDLQILEQDTFRASGEPAPTPVTEGVILGGAWNGGVFVLMTIVVEALALSLTNIWEGDRISTKPGFLSQFWIRHIRKVPPGIREDHLLYLRSAVHLGKDDVLTGYRSVARFYGNSERQARCLMEECKVHGYLRDRRLRITLPGPDPSVGSG